jgi:hypothetical protein
VDLCALSERSYEGQVNESAFGNDCHELEVDLRALNDRSYEAQVNVFALDDDCLNLK